MKSLYFRNGTFDGHERPPSFPGFESGIFDTWRVRRRVVDGSESVHIVKLTWHLERFVNSCAKQGVVSIGVDELCDRVSSALVLVDWKDAHDCKMRVLSKDEDWYLGIEEWVPQFNLTEGIKLKVVNGVRSSPEHKSLAAELSLSARQLAEDAGADEALLVDGDGIVREGAWSNFFWVDQDGQLVTPATKVLPGITRRAVMEIAPTVERDEQFGKIAMDASEMFITHATHGVVPVSSIDGSQIGSGVIGPVTSRVQTAYEELAAVSKLF